MQKLSPLAQREILKELVSREERLAARKVSSKPNEADLEKCRLLTGPPNVKAGTGMFTEQREFFFDAVKEGRLRVARCTRRAGKTTGAAIKLLTTLLLQPRGVSLYVAKSTTAIRDQIWPELKRLVAEHDLPFEFNETQLRMQHKRSTGRAIFRGASDISQIDKLRGLKLLVAIMDESGTFGAEMEKLVFSVIVPGLRDQGGELLLIGTPGYFPEGLFYEASEGMAHRANWVRRRWTLQENPFLSPHAKSYKAIMAEDGLTPDDPVFIREWKGEYCLNTKVQMFEYDPARNGFRLPAPKDLTYYLGVDFGWTDETAIVALGWMPTARKMYAVKSWAAAEQTSDQVAEHLQEFIAEFRPVRIIGDTGGYGKGPAEQIFRDYGIFIEQAKKLEKLNHVEFMNSAFRRADLLVNLDDTLSYELPRVLWAENKKDAHNTAKDNRSHALLYSWRAANDIAGKTALSHNFSRDELQGWPEHELRDKLGPDYGNSSNGPQNPSLSWFLKEV